MKPLADVLLVTLTKVEAVAVLDAFRQHVGREPAARPVADKTYFELGIVNGASVWLVQSEMGSGGLGAAQQTVTKAIAALSPGAVIIVGIAFGVDPTKQAIGEVLVSQRLMLYDLQRAGTRGRKLNVIPRGDRPHASSWLIDRFRAAELSWHEAAASFGLILTGEKLVDNLAVREQLRALEPEAIGGEMESAGLYVACHDAKVDWILVKAICDWADGKKHVNKKMRQETAAQNAASFVLHTLRLAPLKRAQPPIGSHTVQHSKKAAGYAPTGVLQTGNGGLAIGPGAVAAGAGGVAIGGNVEGGIHLGGAHSPRQKRESR